MKSFITAAVIDANTNTTAESRLGIIHGDYLGHWIKKISKLDLDNAADLAAAALQGKRRGRLHYTGGYGFMELMTPERMWVGENNKQFTVACDVAETFGHLWGVMSPNTMTDSNIRQVLFDLCDHINEGKEDSYYNPKSDPTDRDVSASGRFAWQVRPNGSILMEICRPSGVACSIEGFMREPDTIRIRFDWRLTERRHLHCLFQMLTATFVVSHREAISLIEDSRDFPLLGYNYGEIANLHLGNFIRDESRINS
jgi:hypothetical protein